MSTRTPWGFGGSGAPEGEVWVWESVDPSIEDGRLFSTTPNVAKQVVRAVNAHASLVAALRDAREELALCRAKDGAGPYDPTLRGRIDAALAMAADVLDAMDEAKP